MDTDNLSTEAYEGILMEAEQFHHDLTLQFGVMAASCQNEKEYLMNAKKLIMKIRGLDNDKLSDMFFGSLPDRNGLLLTLDKILVNISNLEKIPESQRHYEW
jgi:hypothetical protein